MQEIWKTVITEDGIYENYKVSNKGKVKSLNYRRTGEEKILSPSKSKKKYLRVCLWKNGKMKNYKVHRLVAYAFIPNANKLPQVNHKDENKENNCVENLEWCDSIYNNNYGSRNKKISKSNKGNKNIGKNNARSKNVICLETGEIFASTREVERQLGICSVSACCRKKVRQAGNLTFRYLEQILFCS